MELLRLFDLLSNYEEKYNDGRVALAGKINGEYVKYTIPEYLERVNAISYGLIKLGVKAGDKVGIISGNRPEWNFFDMAAMQIGAISVPIYPTISQEDYIYILNHAEIVYAFVDTPSLVRKLEAIKEKTPLLKGLITLKPAETHLSLDDLYELGRKNPNPAEVEKRKSCIKTNDLATLIYTSGTTGNPKGVMLSHKNILSQLDGLVNTPAKWSNKVLSFLPMCHAYERVLIYLYHRLGMSIYYAESLGTIAENMKEVNPTMMSCVPRLLEKIYDKLYMAGLKQKGFAKALYFWAFDLAKEYEIEDRSWWYNQQHKIADKLIYSKWRAALGGNFDIVVSGGAAIQKHMVSFFSAIGMPVFEGYGLTETSPVIAVSCRGRHGRKAGTVGPALPGVEIKITGENEIICKGPNVMLGYYKEPELTKEIIKDGWFHTGDTGRFTPEKQLVITGRLKNIFKTSLGKYVNPFLIEEKLSQSPFIDNIIVLGENQKFAAALIVPDFEFLKKWAEKHELPYTTPEEIIVEPKVKERYFKEIKKYNEFFGDAERVKRFELVADEWSGATGILTPTLKIKRNVIMERYSDLIDKLFA